MSKPKEDPKVRVYVYEYLLEMLRANYPQLAAQTDSEIINYLMTEKLGQATKLIFPQELDKPEDDTVSFDDETD